MNSILSKNNIYQAENKLFEIEQALNNIPMLHSEIGLLDGKAGIAIFYYWLYIYTHTEKYLNRCIELLTNSIKSSGKQMTSMYYFNGLAGIVYAVEYLIQKGVLHKSSSLIPTTKKNLIRLAEQSLFYNNYELMAGALGYMYPLLNKSNKKEIYVFTQHLIDKAKIDINKNWCYWNSTDFWDGKEWYCFGIPHGMSGIIRFLSKCIKLELVDSQYANILNQWYNYILSLQHGDSLLERALLPDWIKPGSIDTVPQRLGWCYGDLSIGIALLYSGIDINNPQFISMGKRLLQNSLNRRNMELEKIIDPCICHGTTGLSLLFYKAYTLTQDKQYIEPCKFWLEKTLHMEQQKSHSAGFLFHFGSQGWKEAYGILNGISGVGLTLLSLLQTTTCDWTKSLFID